MKKYIIAFLLCFLLWGCFPDDNPDAVELVHAQIGGRDLYIPKDYLKFKTASVGQDAALIYSWYPGDAIPPSDDSLELVKQDLWYRNIRILISERDDPSISFDKFTNDTIDHLKLVKIPSNQYGLYHFMQDKNGIQDQPDVWLERDPNNEKVVSRIICSEKLLPKDKPNCSHALFLNPGLIIKISYKKKFLPDWKNIKSSTLKMINSFSTPETAQEFILLKRNELIESHKGQQP